MPTMMTEAALERKLFNGVEALGGIAYKFVSPGHAGVPDRIVLMPKGNLFFIELKTRTGVLSELQIAVHNKIRGLGHKVKTLYGKDDVEGFLDEIQRLAVPARRGRVYYTASPVRPVSGNGAGENSNHTDCCGSANIDYAAELDQSISRAIERVTNERLARQDELARRILEEHCTRGLAEGEVPDTQPLRFRFEPLPTIADISENNPFEQIPHSQHSGDSASSGSADGVGGGSSEVGSLEAPPNCENSGDRTPTGSRDWLDWVTLLNPNDLHNQP